jgi:hypothetical protein
LDSLKGAAPATPRNFGHGENIMMVLLGYFLIAAVAAVAASALISLFLTNLILGHFKKSDRLSRWIGSWLLELEKTHILILAVGGSSAFLATKLKLAWPVC